MVGKTYLTNLGYKNKFIGKKLEKSDLFNGNHFKLLNNYTKFLNIFLKKQNNLQFRMISHAFRPVSTQTVVNLTVSALSNKIVNVEGISKKI